MTPFYKHYYEITRQEYPTKTKYALYDVTTYLEHKNQLEKTIRSYLESFDTEEDAMNTMLRYKKIKEENTLIKESTILQSEEI